MKEPRIISDLRNLERLHGALKRRPRRENIELQEVSPGIYVPKKHTIADLVRDMKEATDALKGLK